MSRVWKIKPHDQSLIRSIESTSGVSPVVAQLLAVRGICEPDLVRQFIDCPLQDLRPGNQLPGVEQAAEEIFRAVGNGERIVIYGDYDADGMTATALLYRCLKLLGADVGYHVPNRLDDGYGLNCGALEKISQQGGKTVITVDCGIASLQEAERAKELGLKLIITDHHQFGPQLPDALSIVHPALPGYDYPFAGLCGAGVALKLAWRICQLASGEEKVTATLRQFLLIAMGLAAVGTVADVVPLIDENRLIVKHGINFLKSETVTGLEELMDVTGLAERKSLTAEDLGFVIAPRLNAAGRLGQAQLGVELLTTDSKQRARALADYLHQLNDSRDSLERKISLAANKEIRDHEFDQQPAIVLAGGGWHPGVIGIVAGRIAEKYNRPTVIIAMEEFSGKPSTGSARSACQVDLHRALMQCRDLLVTCGGHRMAAGLTIENSKIDEFRDALCQYVSEHTAPDDFEPGLDIDLEVPLSHLTLDTVNQIEHLAPFGEQNPRPVFCTSNVELVGPPRKIGSGERHLSLKIKHHGVSLRCVAFGQSEWADSLSEPGKRFDMAYQPMINQFRGRRSVELRLLDWRPSAVNATVAALG